MFDERGLLLGGKDPHPLAASDPLRLAERSRSSHPAVRGRLKLVAKSRLLLAARGRLKLAARARLRFAERGPQPLAASDRRKLAERSPQPLAENLLGMLARRCIKNECGKPEEMLQSRPPMMSRLP